MPIWLKNSFNMGIKELYSLMRDPVLLLLVLWTFSFGVYTNAKGAGDAVINNAPIAIVDEDHSPLSERIADAFYPPHFLRPQQTSFNAADTLLDRGKVTFVLVIPTRFEHDVIRYNSPDVQLLVDATQMKQAGIGANYITSIVNGQINEFLEQTRTGPAAPVNLIIRAKFNPNLVPIGFQGVVALINNTTLLTIVLVGAAVIREREYGTIEHALAMPVTPFEIMAGKIWANALVMLIVIAASLFLIVQQVLAINVAGSFGLVIAGVLVYLFSATSIGIFLATIARSMPQLGLLAIMIVVPMNLLSGNATPLESEPLTLQAIMQLVPSTHFVRFAQGVIFRGAAFSDVWFDFTAMAVFGVILFLVALARFRSSMSG